MAYALCGTCTSVGYWPSGRGARLADFRCECGGDLHVGRWVGSSFAIMRIRNCEGLFSVERPRRARFVSRTYRPWFGVEAHAQGSSTRDASILGFHVRRREIIFGGERYCEYFGLPVNAAERRKIGEVHALQDGSFEAVRAMQHGTEWCLFNSRRPADRWLVLADAYGVLSAASVVNALPKKEKKKELTFRQALQKSLQASAALRLQGR